MAFSVCVCPGVYIRGVFVHGGKCPGGIYPGVLFRGVNVREPQDYVIKIICGKEQHTKILMTFCRISTLNHIIVIYKHWFYGRIIIKIAIECLLDIWN